MYIVVYVTVTITNEDSTLIVPDNLFIFTWAFGFKNALDDKLYSMRTFVTWTCYRILCIQMLLYFKLCDHFCNNYNWIPLNFNILRLMFRIIAVMIINIIGYENNKSKLIWKAEFHFIDKKCSKFKVSNRNIF